MDRPDGVVQHYPVSELRADHSVNAPVEPAGSVPDLVDDSAAKPRRGRARPRRMVKPATAPISDSPAVTWIQVGPGKFVRVEGRVQDTDQTQTTDATASANPVADAPAHAAPAATVPAETLAGQDPTTTLEISPGDVVLDIAPDDCSERPSTEEYGIAPSAFSADSEVSPLVEGRVRVPGKSAESQADPDPSVNQGERSPWRVVGSGRLWSQQRTSARRSGRLTRGMVSAIAARGRVSWRCDLRTGRGDRYSVWLRVASNVRRQQAARRAFGRMSHVHRALRPRSPPLGQERDDPPLPAAIRGGMGQPRQSEMARSNSPSSTVI